MSKINVKLIYNSQPDYLAAFTKCSMLAVSHGQQEVVIGIVCMQ